MNPVEQYEHNRDEQVRANINDPCLRTATYEFTKHLVRTNYTKNFTWMGRPILQYPSDMFVMQELIWKIRPEVVIETGMAFGGTAVFYASILESSGMVSSKVLSIDIEIKRHNEKAMINHSLGDRIWMLEGDSTSGDAIEEVERLIKKWGSPVMACLDSNHTEDHVYRELQLYAPLVSVGSYIVVFDTAIEFMMTEQPADRPWGPGNNPMTAVNRWMRDDNEGRFVRDLEVEKRALVTAAPGGWLKRIK
jgi:cephalosporin hydroxylase